MSSPISPVLVDCQGLVLAAVSDVAENSLFAFADASEQEAFDAAAAAPLDDGGSAWVNACIDFKGSITGRFTLTLPEPLARHLCAAFAGAESADEVGDGDFLDFVGELANMVCGAWLTRASRHEAFSLTAPRVNPGFPDNNQSEAAASEDVYLSIDDVPIRVQIQWGANDGR
jgi:CheY-specific phosphatase CheX